ncbi:MAG: tetratricopeptide repeat protein [Bacteroidia bacterium]|nr:tetratricopeptide repeat protein [Bacteroidia bacterium]
MTESTNTYKAEISEFFQEAMKVRNVDPDRSLLILNKALSIANEAKDGVLEIGCYIRIALTHQASSRFAEAIRVNGQALDKSIEIGNEECISDSYSGFGNVYYYLGDNERALRYHLDSLKIREKLGKLNKIASTINSVGVVYATMANYPLAESFFKRSLSMHRKLHEPGGICMALNNIGLAALEQKRYGEAISVLNEALSNADLFVEKLPNDTRLTEILTNLADTYTEMGRPEQGRQHIMRAHELLRGRKNIAEGSSLAALARFHKAMGDFENAKTICREAIEIFEALKLKVQWAKVLKLLGDIEMDAGNPVMAMEYTRKYIQLTEELHKEEMLKKTRNLSLIFESENLRKESEINYLKNVELKKAYDEIGVINQNLTDSIQYARHIQEVVFNKHLVSFKSRFAGSFCLSLPKDIVSGDFMWFHDFGDHVIMAVADCTGHGVPGAFLSMLGNDLISKAVIEKQIHSPERVAEYLHLSLREYFPEKELAPKQGMDLLIVRLTRNGALSWAGARGHGLLLMEGEFPKEMYGDRIFLGSTLVHDFQLWEARMERGDRLFLYTDGWTDQKGKEGRKFGKAGLKLVLEAGGPLPEMEGRLRNRMEEWRQDRVQLDDMMLLGMEYGTRR